MVEKDLAWYSGVDAAINCKLSLVEPLLRIHRDPSGDPQRPESALSIGNFDGVHLGHQAMLQTVCAAGAECGLTPAVLTFSPHPREYFARITHRPELSPTQITGLRDKISALADTGVRSILLARFNRSLADMTPEDFVEKLLVDALRTRWLLVGEDFRFGRKRAGDVDLLRTIGVRHGLEVRTLADIRDVDGHRISSSGVRAALAMGNMDHAAELLGRRYAMTGHVIHGRKLGRTLGIPTLNMRVTPRCAARSGIYVVRVFGLGPLPLPGIASLGVRPTVEDHGRILLETHLLDATTDAYGKLVRVEFLQHVRDEEKFPDLPTLTAAMHADAQHARAYFALHGLQENSQSA